MKSKMFPLSLLLIILLLFLLIRAASAGSATWNLNPQNNIWNHAGNWTPKTVPNGPSDIATFGDSSMPEAEPREDTEVNSIVFGPGTPTFFVLPAQGISLTISGTGVINNSESVPQFFTILESAVKFTNSASAGSETNYANNGVNEIDNGKPGGLTQFNDTATANVASFTNNGGFGDGAVGGMTQFTGTATAAAAHFTNNPGISGRSFGGVTEFLDNATAANATFINNPGPPGDVPFPENGTTIFRGNSTAATATFTNVPAEDFFPFPGAVQFFDTSSADHGTFNNSGHITFYDSSTAATGLFALTGGSVVFYDTSTAAAGAFTFSGEGGVLAFHDSSSAGTAAPVHAGATEFRNAIIFYDTSTADHATLTAEGSTTDASLGGEDEIEFDDDSTAGNSTITLNPGTVTNSAGATCLFQENATAGNSTINVNGASVTGDEAGGLLQFRFNAAAGNATLIANGGTSGGVGGTIQFLRDSTGGTSRVEVFGNGHLELGAFRHVPYVTIGSLEGDGEVFLEGMRLVVGSNNINTVFSGQIQDSEDGSATGGAVSKIGSGTLALGGGNSYSGGTVINGGILLANNTTGSATGTSVVRVMAGTLGGSGTIAGATVVGTGSGSGAILGPGKNGVEPGTLTIQKSLKLLADATYRVTMQSSVPSADKVSARGVRISGGQIFLNDLGSSVLSPGTVFTVISNTAATPIAGAFSNLADGAIVTIGGNTFQADYEGGDGNDLTLTVVP